MVEISPEMVAVVFNQGFHFASLPLWKTWSAASPMNCLSGTAGARADLEALGQELAKEMVKEPMGEWFLTVAAGLEYLYAKPGAHACAPRDADGGETDGDSDGEDHDHDLDQDQSDDPLNDPDDTDDEYNAAAAKKPGKTGWKRKALTAKTTELHPQAEQRKTHESPCPDCQNPKPHCLWRHCGCRICLGGACRHRGRWRALMVVLEQLPPKDVLAVIREYDSSKESILNLLVTPEQFARAVVLETQYKDLTHTHLRGMLNSTLFRDDADPSNFWKPLATGTVAWTRWPTYFADKWGRIEAFVRSGTFDPAEDDGRMLSRADLRASAYLRHTVDRKRWPTRTGWSWPGYSATSAPTCSLKCCWCCAHGHRPSSAARLKTTSWKKTTARSKRGTPTKARPPRRPAHRTKSRPFEVSDP